MDASLYTDSDAHIKSNDQIVASGLAWLRHSLPLAQSITDKFAHAIEKGRTCGWDVGTQVIWLVEVHQYTATPTDSDENTPTLATFEWLSQVLGPGAVEPVVSFDRVAQTHDVTWRPRDPSSPG
ncbi:MAG: hypothetical protein ABMA64_26235 [Myxococcota bacterium]